ncbi:MAG: DUF1330 domain-containing protein [Hyphomicrobiales bacterium]
MAAYVIARVNVTDPVQYETYKTLASAAIAKHGGTYLARGGETVTLEGADDGLRVVILEFSNLDAAKAFYGSPEYKEARDARANAADGHFIAVDGL